MKPQRVEGVRQVEQRHVDVVADLVEERTKEGARLDDVAVRSSQHPHADFALAVLEARVETMELALPSARAGA